MNYDNDKGRHGSGIDQVLIPIEQIGQQKYSHHDDGPLCRW